MNFNRNIYLFHLKTKFWQCSALNDSFLNSTPMNSIAIREMYVQTFEWKDEMNFDDAHIDVSFVLLQTSVRSRHTKMWCSIISTELQFYVLEICMKLKSKELCLWYKTYTHNNLTSIQLSADFEGDFSCKCVLGSARRMSLKLFCEFKFFWIAFLSCFLIFCMNACQRKKLFSDCTHTDVLI